MSVDALPGAKPRPGGIETCLFALVTLGLTLASCGGQDSNEDVTLAEWAVDVCRASADFEDDFLPLLDGFFDASNDFETRKERSTIRHTGLLEVAEKFANDLRQLDTPQEVRSYQRTLIELSEGLAEGLESLLRAAEASSTHRDLDLLNPEFTLLISKLDVPLDAELSDDAIGALLGIERCGGVT